MAFLTNNQTLKIDEMLLPENGTYLLCSPFTVFKRKSAAMFLRYSAPNSRHVGKFCGVIVRVHVLTFQTAESLRTPGPSRSFLARWRNILSVCRPLWVLDSIPVEKYRSKRTGINFCFAKVPGPLVNGFLCLGE